MKIVQVPSIIKFGQGVKIAFRKGSRFFIASNHEADIHILEAEYKRNMSATLHNVL